MAIAMDTYRSSDPLTATHSARYHSI